MNLFKPSKVNLHPSEKILILSFIALVSLFFIGLGYTALSTGQGGALFGVGMIGIGVAAIVITYLILHGKGMIRDDT